MIVHKPLWSSHPHVRSGSELSLGERAADRVKHGLGSWSFIGIQTLVVVLWIVLNIVAVALQWDPYPFILLNLLFSTQAAYAAPILQLSNNRSDRQASELALSTHANGETLLDLNKQQMVILNELRALRETVAGMTEEAPCSTSSATSPASTNG